MHIYEYTTSSHFIKPNILRNLHHTCIRLQNARVYYYERDTPRVI